MSNALEPMHPGHPMGPAGAAHLPASARPPMVVDQDDEDGGVNLLAVAWRSRWSILLCTILGGLGAWAYLQRVTPLYTSTARVYVEQNTPRLLSRDNSMTGFSTKYLYTQAELIRSAPVLTAAVEAPENASLETFREIDNPVGLLLEKLAVEVGERDDLLYLSIELPNPVDAAQIVNSVVDAYITQYSKDRTTNVVEVLDILRKEKLRSDRELDERRKALEDYRSEHVALAVQSAETNVVTELYSALSDKLNNAQIMLIEAKTRYQRAKRMFENPDQLAHLRSLAQANGQDQRAANLEARIQSVEQSLLSEQSRWGDGYPKVKLLKESLEGMREQLAEMQGSVVSGYVDGLQQEYELMVQRRDELQREFDDQFKLATEVSAQAAQLTSLEDAYRRTEKYCDLIDERIREVNLNKEGVANNVQIVDSAAPGMLTYPARPKMLSIGLAIGSIIGFGLAWLRDLLDQRLKSVDEIASVMQLPVIGALPVITGLRGRGESGRSEGGRLVALQPRSPAAEAVRTLRTALHFGVAGAESKVHVVTSPAPGDGKSTVASNLAIAMAQSGQRVLLIDADMRKPTQHDIFEIDSDVGLAAVLSGTLAPAETIVETGVSSLDLMPCGKRPHNPVELLTNGVLAEALNHLSKQYDRIVVDCPPVMPVADARMISAMGDCTVLVLRAERSTRRLSVAARDELLKVRTQRLGLVVNAAPMHRAGYGYGAYSAYGYGNSVYGGYDEETTTTSSRPRLKPVSENDPRLTSSDA